ncbi:MAG: peptidase M3, partial [Pseudomonadota bacterium]
MTNPLRAPWTTEFDLPPFDLIEDAHFAPAVEEAMAEARANIAAITDGSAPTFANTIEAMALADAPLEKALAPFFALAG